MKKSTLIGGALFIILAGYAIYLATKDSSVSKLKPNSNFAIENIDKVDKIVIRDVDQSVATLTKEGDEWYVNNKYQARPESIEIVLNTAKNIKVQSNVAKSSVKAVIGQLASNSKKVDFYVDGDLVKTYYVGNPTQDHYGTFMLLETPNEGKSSIPYIMHIPGFNGFLSTRFHAIERDWRYTGVFTIDPKQITSVKVGYPSNPEKGFEINQTAGFFNLVDASGNNLEKANKALIQDYLIGYKKVHLNRFLLLSKEQIDSVKNLTPDITINLTSTIGKQTKVDFYKMKAADGDIDPVTGKQRTYNNNHIAAIINDGDDVVRFQYQIVDKLFMDKDYFLP